MGCDVSALDVDDDIGSLFEELGGHVDHVMALEDVLRGVTGPQNDHILKGQRRILPQPNNPWPGNTKNRVNLT